jgi:GDP-L-fucose synthase
MRKFAETITIKGRLRLDISRRYGPPRKLLKVGRLWGLGWKPRLSLNEGVRDTYRWYGNNFD